MAHSPRGTRSPRRKAGAPALCRHMVSGTISPPSRAAFHLSLTVLVHYRSRKVFSLGSIVLPGSLEVVVPRVTQVRTNKDFLFSFTGLSPSLVARSRVLRLSKLQILYFVHSQGMKCIFLTTPHSFFDVIALQMWFRLFPVRSPLLRECATTAIRFSAFGHQNKLITES